MTHHLAHTYLEERLPQPGHLRIFVRSWRPTATTRAIVVICHGVNSHGGQYIATAEKLVDAGLAVYTLDLRGRGRSDGPRFYVEDIDDYVADVDATIRLAKSRDRGLPLFLLGHSAGGVVSTTYALDHSSELAGLICESFAYRVPAPKLVLNLVKAISHVAPRVPVLKLKNRDFTRDPEALAALEADPMILNEAQPAATVAALTRANERLERSFGQITLPVFILHGTADRATLPAGSEQFARDAGSKDKTLRLYDGHVHDLLADLGREIVLTDILNWINARIAT